MKYVLIFDDDERRANGDEQTELDVILDVRELLRAGYYSPSFLTPVFNMEIGGPDVDSAGWEITLCECAGGPHFGARRSGSPACCEDCGMLARDHFEAIRRMW